MPYYCVNKVAQPNDDHEVHDTSSTQGCLPTQANRLDLGYHQDCQGAVQAAKQHYRQSNGCFYCARPCHTT